jgi:hypothetical protein
MPLAEAKLSLPLLILIIHPRQNSLPPPPQECNHKPKPKIWSPSNCKRTKRVHLVSIFPILFKSKKPKEKKKKKFFSIFFIKKKGKRRTQALAWGEETWNP